ncbi:sigma-70 family RNA polymerase sigma factor [Candidatus Entotheonella palauensis]|uniref:sigma-70 family RNA polymerase sigma factor n=1 Tax=Candidatus Entotheonella palauensis TaxID=93172 RepID=UPI0015C47926|nr:sigma-70 family RNA polymerase sigma factor [Candidatus Entotheonella palauensis]
MWKDDGTVNWHEVIVRLTQWVRQRVGDPAEAEDLVQDILERLVRREEQLAAVENPLGWMHRIAVNAMIDLYRRRKPHVALPEALPAETADTMAASRQELAACLRPLISHLDPSSRQALLATDLGGKSQVEAAHEAGVAVSTMKSRIQRGRRKLHDAVRRCCHIELDRRNGVIDFSQRQAVGTGCEPCCMSGQRGEMCIGSTESADAVRLREG